ncbi:hypothetical protein KBD34_01090 [Patescibacteria group bacterium]|nr:hypothetical protein [Patescibacteria group bacterium]
MTTNNSDQNTNATQDDYAFYNPPPRSWREAPAEDIDAIKALIAAENHDEIAEITEYETSYHLGLLAAHGYPRERLVTLVLQHCREASGGLGGWTRDFLKVENGEILDYLVEDGPSSTLSYLGLISTLIEQDAEGVLANIERVLLYRARPDDGTHVWHPREWDREQFSGLIPWLDFAARERIRDALIRHIQLIRADLMLRVFSTPQQLMLFFGKRNARLTHTKETSKLAAILALRHGTSEAECKKVFQRRSDIAEMREASHKRDKIAKPLIEDMLAGTPSMLPTLYCAILSVPLLDPSLTVRSSWLDEELRAVLEQHGWHFAKTELWPGENDSLSLVAVAEDRTNRRPDRLLILAENQPTCTARTLKQTPLSTLAAGDEVIYHQSLHELPISVRRGRYSVVMLDVVDSKILITRGGEARAAYPALPLP